MPRRSPISPPARPLLVEDSWERRHELTFALELNRAECEFLTGALAEAEQRLTAAFGPRRNHARNAPASPALLADLYTTLDQGSRAIAVGSTISGISASTGRRTRRKTKRGASMSGSGPNSDPARSRSSSICP